MFLRFSKKVDLEKKRIKKYRKAFEAGTKWMQEKMIEEACEWLSNVSIEDMYEKYDEFDTSEGWYKFIDDFKEAMKQ